MSVRKRLHRVDPARVGPSRDFSKLYSRQDSVNGTPPAKPAQSDSPRKAGGGPLAKGVELAYSVIERYIAEGRRTAEGFSSQPYATRATNDNLQDVLERTLRFQAEMLPLWIETLATLVKADPWRNGHAPTPQAGPPANGPKNASTMAVSIEVASLRPVQVSVELQPNSEAESLVSLGLNAIDPSKPTLRDISLIPDEVPGRIKLRLRIPDSQPGGVYSGVIVNRNSGEARGTLSIRIAD
jgi:hypothetical protein